MKFEMVMPKMGESITEGTVLKWLKGVGDTVEKDETILEISTDKVDSEIPTPVPGTIIEILATENETVDVGVAIAIIETEAKAGGETEMAKPETESGIKTEPVTETLKEPIQTKSAPKKSGNRFYSPVVMKIAAAEALVNKISDTPVALLAVCPYADSTAVTPLTAVSVSVTPATASLFFRNCRLTMDHWRSGPWSVRSACRIRWQERPE